VGTGSLTMNGGTTLAPTGDNRTLANPITLNGGTAHFGGANLLTLTGIISGTGILDVIGSISLENQNTYVGATMVTSGTLGLRATNALPTSTAVTVSSGATLEVDEYNVMIGSLAGAGDVTLEAPEEGSLTFSVGNGRHLDHVLGRHLRRQQRAQYCGENRLGNVDLQWRQHLRSRHHRQRGPADRRQ